MEQKKSWLTAAIKQNKYSSNFHYGIIQILGMDWKKNNNEPQIPKDSSVK